jgi:hypothetical protein
MSHFLMTKRAKEFRETPITSSPQSSPSWG